MIKALFYKTAFFEILFGVAVVCLAFKPVNQAVDIVLHNERMAITPKEFYIADVIDERDNHNPIAKISAASQTKGSTPKTYAVDLHGGTPAALKQFILQSLPIDKSFRAVVIGIKKLSVVETALAGGRAEGHITFGMAFYLDKGQEDKIHLADYNGTAVYTRTPGPPQQIEPTLRLLLQNGLAYLNNWMNQQAASNIKLAKSVKLNFVEYHEQTEGDSIYYDKKRPLTWADFQSKIPSSRFDAEVFPTIGYEEHNDIAKGIINVTIILKVCLPKSACWVNKGSRNAYVLNHEQRHFDIAEIIAERFKRKLLTEDLPVGNYDGPINVDYLDAYRDMNKLQKQYDDETKHGSNEEAQQQWNVKIDKELEKLGKK